MTHRFAIKEIARQSGLGTATVDRVINNRANVSPQTRRRVSAAISELERQEAQLSARGRRMFFDVIIEAPIRFSREIERAALDAATDIGAAVCRPRFQMQEVMSEDDLTTLLARIEKRGSQGVLLKARNVPAIRTAIDRLARVGIPVVTLVTDIPACDRLAYVGLDNISAGRTAAYLVAQSVQTGPGTILTTRSQSSFLGEEERARAFQEAIAQQCPGLKIIDASGGSGVPYPTSEVVRNAVNRLADLRAVYSMGGGNRAILDILHEHHLTPKIYVSHDLDRENSVLLSQGRVQFVLHHDLRQDIRNAYLAFLGHHGVWKHDLPVRPSAVQIISPENLVSSH